MTGQPRAAASRTTATTSADSGRKRCATGCSFRPRAPAGGGPRHRVERPPARVGSTRQNGNDAPGRRRGGREDRRVGGGELARRARLVRREADGRRDAPALEVGEQARRVERVAVGVAAEVHVRVDRAAARQVATAAADRVLQRPQRRDVGAGPLERVAVLAEEPHAARPRPSNAAIASRIAPGMRVGRGAS